jgi:hypothetical protein
VNKLKILWQLYRNFGPGWLLYRLSYALRVRSGWLRRQMPAIPWDAQPLAGFLSDSSLADPLVYLAWREAHAPRFFFTPEDSQLFQRYFKSWDQDSNPCQEADDIARGNFRYFRHSVAQAGFPPDWRSNPFTGQSYPTDRHWSQIGDFDHGDIKVIWELNRFGFTYTLLRAYWRTGDEGYPERFWRLVEDWRTHNPPQMGANWKCGQETSFRLMAWCYGLYGFLGSPASTADRVSRLAQMAAVSARRIEGNLSHALSQQNNHGVSEGMGLWTAGLLFPEFRDSPRWLARGRQVLERLGRELIYADGSFSQHSASYQRLALLDYIWALRLGELNNQPFSQELQEQVKKSAELLYQVQEEASGRLPCFGHNDGSLVLPLDSCDYQDYRPVIQAACYLTTGARRYGDGPWDEGLLWLFGPQAFASPVNPEFRIDIQAREGGYYTLRSKSGFAFIHCASFHHRPAHADLLNIDIWWRGLNITLDAGSYNYNAPAPWDHPLGKTIYHNAVTVDGLDQMEPVGRFLWLPWAKGTVLAWQRSDGGRLAYWEGLHDGYHHLPHPVRVRRGVLHLGPDNWLVMDQMDSDAEHTYRLGWLLPDLPYTLIGQTGQLSLDAPAGKYHIGLAASLNPIFSLVRAVARSPRGWQSPYYYSREPALSLDCTVKAKSLSIWTILGPDPCQVTIATGAGLVESSTWRARLDLPAGDAAPLIQSVSWKGEVNDSLAIKV